MDVIWFLILTAILPSGEMGGEVLSAHPAPDSCQLHAQSARDAIEKSLKESGKKGVDIHLHCIAHPIPQEKIY